MGKLFVFGAAVQRRMVLLAVVGVLNSVISVYYYYKIMRPMLFDQADSTESIQVTPAMGLVVGVSSAMVLIIALFAEPFIRLATESVQMMAAAF